MRGFDEAPLVSVSANPVVAVIVRPPRSLHRASWGAGSEGARRRRRKGRHAGIDECAIEILLERQLAVDLGIDRSVEQRGIAGGQVETRRLGLAEARREIDARVALPQGLRLELFEHPSRETSAAQIV